MLNIQLINEEELSNNIYIICGWNNNGNYAIAVDQYGNSIWYETTPMKYVLDMSPNGSFIGMGGGRGIEIDRNSNIIFQTLSEYEVHHSFIKTNYGTYLTLIKEYQFHPCPAECEVDFSDGVIWKGDIILELDSNSNIIWIWNLFDDIGIQNYNVFEDKSKYYISHNEDYFSESYSLRKFHNYIKSKLIIGIGSSFKKKIQLLDLSSGRGGDILKYMDNDTNLKFMLGLDISSDISESCERYYFSNSPKPLAVFLRADTSKNIMNTQCSIIDDVDDQKNKKHTETMLSILYNNSNPIPKKYKKIQTKYKNLAKDGFDIISSQFPCIIIFNHKIHFKVSFKI